MKTLLTLLCVVLLSACGGTENAAPADAPSGSPEVSAPADAAPTPPPAAETSQPAAAPADAPEGDGGDAVAEGDGSTEPGKLTPVDGEGLGDGDGEGATAAPDDTAPSGDTSPAPKAKPEREPDLSCSEGSGCFVYFREQRCNFTEPIAIPVRQKRTARKLYPSSTADQPVSCKAPGPDAEAKALERFSAECVKGTCKLIDDKPMGRGRR